MSSLIDSRISMAVRYPTHPLPHIYSYANSKSGVDVWLDICYHSHFAPPRVSTDLRPEYLIAGGGHHWDSYGILDVAAEPDYIRGAHLWEIRTVKKWLRDFGSWKP